MLDNFRNIVSFNCVKNVPEISSSWQATLRSLIWHVSHKFFVFMHKRPKLFHREFIVLGNVDLLHVSQIEKLLFFNEHQLDEVLIQHLCWGNVKLQLLLEILDEVILGTEASKQLLSQVLPLLG